jgi:hypothetical protein
MSDEMKVMSMLGCTEEEARVYLDKAEGDVLKAIEDNLNIRVVSGEKYIPAPRVIDDGLDPEVREKLNEARKLTDLFNASFRNDLLVSPAKTSDEAGAVESAAEVAVEVAAEVAEHV